MSTLTNNRSQSGHVSLWAYCLCAMLMAYASLVFYPRWQKPGTESCLAYDTEGYYWYLPSTFIYHNLKSQQYPAGVLHEIQATHNPEFANGYPNETGDGYILKYTSGMAILYSPAFFTGHVMAHFLHYPQNGFSPPYKLAFQLWGLLFGLAGLYFFRRLMLRFFSDGVVAAGLIILVLGTNYLNYAAIDVGMSHTWLFSLYVYLLWTAYYFAQTGKSRYLILSGMICGLVTLVRPTEVIAVLVPLLWGVNSRAAFTDRIRFVLRRWPALLLGAALFLLIVGIQLCYWKYVSGHWVQYSYQDQGFNFRRPHAIVYSWSYRAGWLRYCPMMVLSYVGLLFYFRSGRNVWMVYVLAIVNYFIVSSWNIWDYGGFSGRAMIQSYPILFFPFLYLLECCLQRKWLQVALLPILLLCFYINIWWTYQAHKGAGVIDPFTTTKEYYYKMVGRWSIPEEYQKLKDTPELLDEMSVAQAEHIFVDSMQHSVCVDKEHSDDAVSFLKLSPLQGCSWLRVTADFHVTAKEWDTWSMPQYIVEFRKGGQVEKVNMIRVFRFLDENDNKPLYLDVKVPATAYDEISVRLWNADSDKKVCMDNIRLTGLKGDLRSL